MLWENTLLHENFDIILDDGLHAIEHNKIFFENSIHKLKVGGVYIIEDIFDSADCYNSYNKQMQIWMKTYPKYDFRIYNVEGGPIYGNNVLIIVKRVN